jgi:hypothetical protein
MAANDVTEPAVQALIAAYRNDTWGEMRTTWAFTITGGKISRFETGQATP